MSSLAPDGVFVGAMLGGETLQELRSAFAIADTERLGMYLSQWNVNLVLVDCRLLTLFFDSPILFPPSARPALFTSLFFSLSLFLQAV